MQLYILDILRKMCIRDRNHPFELYSGERFEDLADSIKACGMITPLLIRMLDDNTYQILAGHNRNNAAKAIGLETVPCIVLTDLTDDDALMIMLDSNTNQRSISEMSISQQAHICLLYTSHFYLLRRLKCLVKPSDY